VLVRREAALSPGACPSPGADSDPDQGADIVVARINRGGVEAAQLGDTAVDRAWPPPYWSHAQRPKTGPY
jgi:hypothetical protein